MIVHLTLTTVMFQTFMFATFWFAFFNEGPESWMQNEYFTQKSSKSVSTSDSDDKSDTGYFKKLSVNIDLIQSNIKMVLIALGVFCSLVTFIHYINL